MSNLNKWNDWYKELSKEPTIGLYGNTCTYELGGEFLKDCKVVEDWGTGTGAFKLHCKDAIGIDGSNTPQAAKKSDLVDYTSSCDGIFMRHVLEHNSDWEKILENALKSAKKKVCIVFFIPLSEKETIELPETSAQNRKYGVDVPTFSINLKEFNKILKDNKFTVKKESYSTETIFYLTKEKVNASKNY